MPDILFILVRNFHFFTIIYLRSIQCQYAILDASSITQEASRHPEKCRFTQNFHRGMLHIFKRMKFVQISRFPSEALFTLRPVFGAWRNRYNHHSPKSSCAIDESTSIFSHFFAVPDISYILLYILKKSDDKQLLMLPQNRRNTAHKNL